MNADDDDGQLPASLQALEEATVRQGRVEFTTHKEEIKFKKNKTASTCNVNAVLRCRQ